MNYATKIEVNDPFGTVEDAAGALTTVGTVLAVACAAVEDVTAGLELGTAPNEVLCGRTKEIWALVTQAETSLADNIAILHAVVDRRPGRLTILMQRTWAAALLTYQQATEAVDGQVIATIENATSALNNLLHCRAPTHDALLEKLRIIGAEGYEGNSLAWSSIVNDVRVLGGGIEE